jgi:hypothetical protein
MQTTYGSCVGRAGLVGLLAPLVLGLWPATGLAAGGAAQARPVLVAVAQAKSVPLARWAAAGGAAPRDRGGHGPRACG